MGYDLWSKTAAGGIWCKRSGTRKCENLERSSKKRCARTTSQMGDRVQKS